MNRAKPLRTNLADIATVSRGKRGQSLVEALASMLVVTFLVAGAATLFKVGEGQEEDTRMYSNLQTNIRDAIRPMTRVLRHAYSVNASGTLGTLIGQTSSAAQIECTIPQTPGNSNIEMLFYVSGGTLYYERSTDAAPGTALLTGVNSMGVVYYTTSNGTTTVAATPSAATEIQVTISATEGPVTTSAQAYVWLRN